MKILPNTHWVTNDSDRIGNCIVIEAREHEVELLTDWGNLVVMPKADFIEIYDVNEARTSYDHMHDLMELPIETFQEKIENRIELLNEALQRYEDIHGKG